MTIPQSLSLRIAAFGRQPPMDPLCGTKGGMLQSFCLTH